jgi:lipocalin
MKCAAVAMAAAALACGGADAGSLRAQRPQPVAQLNVSQYTGRWYQMYTDAIVVDTFETHSQCDTADYKALADGTISLRNGDLNTTSGLVNHIDGIATIPDATQPGKLLVKFTDGVAVPFPAPYWVMKLGPLRTYPGATSEQYSYSIVADNLLPVGTLFVLGRDPVEFDKDFDAEVTDFLKTLGFDLKFNDPIKTYQGSNCSYLPIPTSE